MEMRRSQGRNKIFVATAQHKAALHLILQLLEHLFDVDNAKRLLSPAEIFVQYDKLPDRDLVSLDGTLLCMEGAHVCDEGLGDLGR
jgi:hypothetical protein